MELNRAHPSYVYGPPRGARRSAAVDERLYRSMDDLRGMVWPLASQLASACAA
jgi:hypothetical protein